ncbi:MAG: acyltransferase [Gemmatimonadota bacterium]|nr:acyltransferase [Gemmatimonadota bacterium]MDH3366456.1 acyltransferase [Gemmatimonadota bacterium]MDH3476682.1 acyltransferase [Gemmatimonadota bacterium]MDH3571265.1 acyltransferase [Gemmatimonadota bacterium]MDH5550730.1 acyltransferase [Gemmatimonadota bacterium]
MRSVTRRLAYALLGRQLRRAFRRIVWLEPWRPPTLDRPVVIYANHHAFYDAQILGYVVERVLRRHAVVWMEELDRFPFLAMLGARPFPMDDPARRTRTIRETARLMASRPDTMLIYFPEAHLHPIEEGILPFPADRLKRLASVLPRAQWWPVVLRLTGWQDATPTAVLASGTLHDEPTGAERSTLTALLDGPAVNQSARRVLLEGRRGPHERWNLRSLGSLFRRRR